MTRTIQRHLSWRASPELRGDVTLSCQSRSQKRDAIDHVMIGGIARFFNEPPGEIGAVAIHSNGDPLCSGADQFSTADNNVSDPGDGSKLVKRAVANELLASLAGLMFWGI